MRKHRNNKQNYNLEDLFDIRSQYQITEQGNIKSNHEQYVANQEAGRVSDMDRSRSIISLGGTLSDSKQVSHKNTTKVRRGSSVIEKE